MLENFVPQPYPLWAGFQEEADTTPTACPVIGWVRDPDGPDLLPVLGLAGQGETVRHADLVEFFPTYELAQQWVTEHPATAEAAERRRLDAKVTRLPAPDEEA